MAMLLAGSERLSRWDVSVRHGFVIRCGAGLVFVETWERVLVRSMLGEWCTRVLSRVRVPAMMNSIVGKVSTDCLVKNDGVGPTVEQTVIEAAGEVALV